MWRTEPGSTEPNKFNEGLALVTPTRSCPNCGAARMILIEEFPPLRAVLKHSAGASTCVVVDSS